VSMHIGDIVILGSALAAIAYGVRFIVRATAFFQPGSVSDDIRADAKRALNDPRRLTR
jgi:hypothetical protein